MATALPSMKPLVTFSPRKSRACNALGTISRPNIIATMPEVT